MLRAGLAGRCAVLALTACIVWAGAVAAQGPILELFLEPEVIQIPIGGTRVARLRVVNRSVYAADDLEVALLQGDGVRMGEVKPVVELRPFSETVIQLPLSVPDDQVEGDSAAVLELVHTYCVGDLCYQIVETLELHVARTPPVEVTEPPVEPDAIATAEEASQEPGRTPWRTVIPIGLGLTLLGALVATTRPRWARGGQVVLLIAGMASLAYGLSLQQADQAQGIGAVLCTSCVGIEEAPKEPPVLSAQGIERLKALREPIELIVFSAEWCHSCPYAKAMVTQLTEVTPLVSASVVDVDEDRDLADRYGIVQSGRVIVPAILRLDTEEVVYGIEGLEARLLTLLEDTR